MKEAIISWVVKIGYDELGNTQTNKLFVKVVAGLDRFLSDTQTKWKSIKYWQLRNVLGKIILSTVLLLAEQNTTGSYY